MNTIERFENIPAADIPFNYRAYYTEFIGDFDVLEAYVVGLKGVVYKYECGYGIEPKKSQDAIVLLPSGVTMSNGKMLSNDGRICEVLYAGWITTP